MLQRLIKAVATAVLGLGLSAITITAPAMTQYIDQYRDIPDVKPPNEQPPNQPYTNATIDYMFKQLGQETNTRLREIRNRLDKLPTREELPDLIRKAINDRHNDYPPHDGESSHRHTVVKKVVKEVHVHRPRRLYPCCVPCPPWEPWEWW